MSGQPTVNIVDDDDEMSSQGSINAPMVAPSTVAQVQPPTRQQYETPSGLPAWPQPPMAQSMQAPIPTAQSSVFAGRSGVAPTVPIATGSVQPSVVAPTVPVDVPSRQETKEAFQEVSSAFQDMSTKHGKIQGSLQVLASMVEALKQAQQGEVASSAQVQEMLCRTALVASDLEAKLGATSVAQEQSRVTIERAQIMSEKAIREMQMLQLTQQATAVELKDEVAKIGMCIQKQSERTLLQEQTRKEQQDQTTEQLSQRMQAGSGFYATAGSRCNCNWRYRHNRWRNLLRQRCPHMNRK